MIHAPEYFFPCTYLFLPSSLFLSLLLPSSNNYTVYLFCLLPENNYLLRLLLLTRFDGYVLAVSAIVVVATVFHFNFPFGNHYLHTFNYIGRCPLLSYLTLLTIDL
jgi:hypothetical protein